jgi:hypothetical protein
MRFFLSLLLFYVASTNAADVCIRYHTGGTRDGAGWDTAYTNYASASFSRGDTLWFADNDAVGTYPAPTFNKAASGGTLVTVKKATIADHPSTGWDDSYGDGVCVFATELLVHSSNWVFDGNGTHTIPTNNLGAYGFRVASSTTGNNAGIIEFGAAATTVSNITLKGFAVTNNAGGETAGNVTVMVRFYPGLQHHHIKLQNCWFKNSGKDGIQISDSYAVLVERCYVERLGKLLESGANDHGQTVQMFAGNFAAVGMVFRWNTWDSCEGQSMIAGPDNGNPAADKWEKVRFYGNVIFNPFGTTRPAGFNSSGGIIGNAWDTGDIGLVQDGSGMTNILVYNNSIINNTNSYVTESTANHFPVDAGTPRADIYIHNNLIFNSQVSSATSWTASSHHASGIGVAGGTSEQTGLTSAIFVDYENNNFRLASATDAAKDVTTIPGYDSSADSFFGQLDYNVDMYGETFTSRGALMVADEAPPPDSTVPVGRKFLGFRMRAQ